MKGKSCSFCRIVQGSAPAFVVYEDDDHLAFLDKFPQSRGHLQLIPKTHVRWIWEISDMGTFFTVAGRIIRAIIPALDASHVRIAAIGDEVAHAHMWIVPQYQRSHGTHESKEKIAKILRNALKGA